METAKGPPRHAAGLFLACDSVRDLCAVNEREYYLLSRTEADSVQEQALGLLIELPE